MATKDYVPSSDNDFLAWAKNLNAIATASCSHWGVQSPTDFIPQALDTFESKLLKANLPNHGRIDVIEKNEARKILEKQCRVYVQGFVAKNPNVTNGEREKMGLNVHDDTPTNIPAPVVPVDAEIHYPAEGLIELRNIRAIGERPDNRSDYGVRIYYGILGEPDAKDRFRISVLPKTGEDLPHSVFTRQKKHRFNFSGDSGNKVFFCMRFENSKGEAGPWGRILQTFIP